MRDDGGERRAQIVRDVREELRLQRVARFELGDVLQRLLELRLERHHATICGRRLRERLEARTRPRDVMVRKSTSVHRHFQCRRSPTCASSARRPPRSTPRAAAAEQRPVAPARARSASACVPLLDDASLVQHDDPCRVADGAHAVRRDHRRAAGERAAQRRAESPLRCACPPPTARRRAARCAAAARARAPARRAASARPTD